MKKNAGFTLIELMIVVAIIAIIAAIAIPNLLRARLQSNESATVGNIEAINTAQISYNAANGSFATTFDQLTTASPPFLDGDWTGAKSGYNFTLGGDADCFTVNADPTTPGSTGNKYFYSDCSGVIRYSTAGAADSSSTPIGEVES
jgi:prepilin-type N-terminal cleavage/methylation domain-containing protein